MHINENSFAYKANRGHYLRIQAAIKKKWISNVKKEWSSANDSRCCDLCQKLNGIVVDMDNKFLINGIGVLFPPLHDDCRCVISYIEN